MFVKRVKTEDMVILLQLVAVVVLFLPREAKATSVKSGLYAANPDHSANNVSYSVGQVSLFQCAGQCNLDKVCTAFSYDAADENCRISEAAESANVMPDTGWTFYSSGWVQLATGHYRMSTVPMSWYNGKTFCEDLGAHQVKLETLTEFQTVAQLCLAAAENCFAGAKEDGHVFYWEDGSSLAVSGPSVWNSGEPNFGGGYAVGCTRYEQSGRWNDASCEEEQIIICEKN